MKMDRKWIVLAAVAALLLIPACTPTAPPVTEPPPATREQAPATDVTVDPTPAGPVDPVEAQPPMSIQEMQKKLEAGGLIGDVFYDFDRYDLREDARQRLAKNAKYMNGADGSGLTFTIEGHCDERGTNEYNIALGQSRSSAALDYLVSLGVDRSRLKLISYGEERPFCHDSNARCWQQNRRARFVVSGRS